MNDDTTIKLISLALDASLMRETAIASNIANANTRGYQTLEVNFEQQLTQVNRLKPFYQVSKKYSALDEQMMLSVKNETQYRALIKGLNEKLAIMKLALHGVN